MIGGPDAFHTDLVAHEGNQEHSLTEVTRGLAVFLAYDQADTARSALAFLDQVGSRLGGEVGLDTRVWRMDLIEDPECAWQARADAAATDLLLVALGSTGALPAGFGRWLEEWAGHGEIQEAALALWTTGATPQALTPAARLLQRVAERHRLTFVCGNAVAGLIGQTAGLMEPQHQNLPRSIQADLAIREVPLGEWGLNE